jgi:hypothetical protein
MEYKMRSVVAKHPESVPRLSSNDQAAGFLHSSSSRKPSFLGNAPTNSIWVMTNATVIIIVIMDPILFSFN